MQPKLEMNTDQLIEIKVSIAKLDEKLDGVINRLDTMNGSVARLQAASVEHDKDLAGLVAEKDLLAKLVKPSLIVLGIAVSILMGHSFDLKQIVELFSK